MPQSVVHRLMRVIAGFAKQCDLRRHRVIIHKNAGTTPMMRALIADRRLAVEWPGPIALRLGFRQHLTEAIFVRQWGLGPERGTRLVTI